MNKKPGWKRLGMELLQHLFAVALMVAAAGLLLNSYIAVESIDGTESYRIFSMDVSQEFEESDVFHDLFCNAVSDITQLAVIKEQLETNDTFNPDKKIDVTAYAEKIGEGNDCRVTAVYDLDDLIKWGKYGANETIVTMSMTEFINYFGYVLYPENFALDEYGQLCFGGFYLIGETEGQQEVIEEVTIEDADAEESETMSEMLAEYTDDQLEDMVFSYIMGKNLDGIEVAREDDGRLRVSVSMLDCRYPTVDGSKRLLDYADNWVDYMLLQSNVESAVTHLTTNYQRYQVCNEAYREGSTNVSYMIRMMTDSGMQTYTNVAQLKAASDEDVTEFFSEYRRYLIYYPDSLVFMGNTMLSEEELDSYISVYDYAYPDTTHIWLGVDTGYSVEGDAFCEANELYEKIVPNVGKIIGLMVLFAVLWLVIGIYLTVTTAGREQLNRFDRIWTEVFLLLGAACVFAGIRGFELILKAAAAGAAPEELMGIQLNKIYRYSAFGLYGICVSVAVDLFWFSLVRRVRYASLWTDSFLHKIWVGLGRTAKFVFHHSNSVISILIPYNLFLFANLSGLVILYKLNQREEEKAAVILLLLLIVIDCMVGVRLFKQRAERMEIVEGINRIRDGEVDFKLDTNTLHGANKELADAVNNIGEGIRKAVKTSMKDEQMKTDLITNVSHDIKTPLTSIINYVDLLKRLKIEEEPAKGYIAILDGKAQRLKQLTDDLVEASKISSGNIELNREKLNLTELLNQTIGEFSEKLEEKELVVVFEKEEHAAYIFADSRRMWRVMDNLFNNICKYALEGTRVYIDMETENGQVEVSVKNISKQQMNIHPDELTERFIRGDSSRSTEGSGLGLSIAKNLVKAQGGTFEILLDGDLFKIVIGFPEYQES